MAIITVISNQEIQSHKNEMVLS